MRLPHQTDLAGVDVAILGVPFDSGTSYRSGARLGPREIRAQSSLIRPYSYFQKVSPFETLTVVDAGDVDAPPVGIEKAYEAIEAGVRRILDAGAIPMIAGGDHSISLPILRAVAGKHGPVSLVQFIRTSIRGDYFGVMLRGRRFGAIEALRASAVSRHPGRCRRGVGASRMPAVETLDIVVRRDSRDDRADSRRVAASRDVTARLIRRSRPARRRRSAGTRATGAGAHCGLAGLVVGCDVVGVAPPFDGPGPSRRCSLPNLLFELLCVVPSARRNCRTTVRARQPGRA